MTRGAFGLLELIVAAAVLGLFLGVGWQMFHGGMKQITVAGDHQVALRNAVILTTALQGDLRAVAVLNQRREKRAYPVTPHTLVLSPGGRSLKLRVSAPIEALDRDPASRFFLVTWQLVESGKPHTYVLRREERTASGDPLPGSRNSMQQHTFEELTLADLRFGMSARLLPMEVRQSVTLELTAVEGDGPKPKRHTVARTFLLPAPEPPTGPTGGPRGFAFDFPPPPLASQLSGGVELTGRPGNVDELEAPPDAVDRRGRPVAPGEEASGPDPFQKLEPRAGPLRGQFLHAALDRLEQALGAQYRGPIAGVIPADPAVRGAEELRFRLDATGTGAKPLITQIEAVFERVRARGAKGVLELCQLFQMEAPPGSDLPPLEAARQLAEEPVVSR